MSLPDNFSFVDDHLAGSSQPLTISQINVMWDLGVRHIFSLTPASVSKLVRESGKPIEVHHFPTNAIPDPQDISKFMRLMTAIIQSNNKAVVHCTYGQERTGIYLASYLKIRESCSVDEAIRRLWTLRPISLKNSTSIEFVYNLFSTNSDFESSLDTP